MAPKFIIPPGTQVVLRQNKRVPGTANEIPAGSVAEVIESPATNYRTYRIRFFDGIELRVKVGEVLVRRVDHGVEYAETFGPDVTKYIILKVTLGSRAFGLATNTSDKDHRGIYLSPADWHWSLTKPPDQVDSASAGVEEVIW
ncbi:MAG TPA: nucleotidyltransferase domain-containing protein, partial [Fimbriiglobus sp.]